MINRIRNPHQAEVLYLNEPQTIAEYDPKIMESSQSFSHKTYMIMFAYKQFKQDEEQLCSTTMEILNSTIKDYPELAPEVRERYPHIEFTGDLPFFDSSK